MGWRPACLAHQVGRHVFARGIVGMAHDALGIEVPPRLGDVFNGRRMLMTICEDLDLARRKLHALVDMPCSSQLDMGQLLDDLNTIRMTILKNSPFTLCDCRPTDTCPKSSSSAA